MFEIWKPVNAWECVLVFVGTHQRCSEWLDACERYGEGKVKFDIRPMEVCHGLDNS